MRSKKNLSLHDEVVAIGEKLAAKRSMSLSGLVEILIRNEAVKDENASVVKELAELRADVARLKEAAARQGKKS